jgi:hypothetical protein
MSDIKLFRIANAGALLGPGIAPFTSYLEGRSSRRLLRRSQRRLMDTGLRRASIYTAVEVSQGSERIKGAPRRRHNRNVELVLGILVIVIVIVLLVRFID